MSIFYTAFIIGCLNSFVAFQMIDFSVVLVVFLDWIV